MKTTRVLLSLNMKRLRESAGLDQDDLAEAAGLSKVMVAQLEQARKAPSPETLDKIAFGLGVSQAELLKDSDAFEQPAETVAQMTPAQLEALKITEAFLTGEDRLARPPDSTLKRLINSDAAAVSILDLLPVLERFLNEAPQVRASALSVLYGDAAISRLYASADKANSR